MRSTLKPALRLLVLCAAAGGSVWAATRAADLIETHNKTKVAAALAQDGFDWVEISTDGLNATLSGTAPDETARFRALRAASARINPSHLRDAMTVLPPENLPAPEFRLELLRAGDKVTLLGLLPGGSDAPDTLQAQLADLTPGLDLSSLVTASAEPAPEGWDTAVQQAVTTLSTLQDARIFLRDGTFSATGMAPDRATIAALSAQLRRDLPPGTDLTLDLSVPRPVLSPFVTRFRLEDGQAAFDACAAASPSGLATISAAAKAAGFDGADKTCVLAHGAPDMGWDRVAADAITALHGLGSGTVTLSDMTVTLAPGSAATPAAIEAAATRIEATLPSGYRLVLPVPGDGPLAAPARVPTFSATRSPEGMLQVRGPLPHAQGDALVENFTSARFDPDALTLALARRNDLPAGWTLRILAGLDAFSALDAGRLTVTPAMLMLTGVTGQPGLTADIAAALTDALGPSEPFTLDIAYREELDPVSALPTPEECVAEIHAIQARDKVTFAPGSVELDGRSLRIVRRIAEVLRDCGGVAMEISGYTDSQGRAEMNLALSQARADAVFNALLAERVLVGSLSARGYGEEKPVADNDTPEGREANRRIDFTLLYPLQGPPAPDPAAVADSAASQDTTATESEPNGPD